MGILTTPNPILTQPAKLVERISAKGGPASGWDKKILNLIEGMKETLKATENPKGVGLAAPQVGQPWRIFLTRPTPSAKIQVFINPEIIWHSEELTDGVPKRENRLEGCLSLPGIWGHIKRYQTIKLKYKSLDGKTHTQKFSGFMATIIQHEIDHLEGKLFPTRVLEQKGKIYKIEKDTDGKGILEEVKL